MSSLRHTRPTGDPRLDGYLDAYFQEVYLEADDLPTFTKVVQHVSDDALDEYVERLEEEVRKNLTKQVNYGKAAKRIDAGNPDAAAVVPFGFDRLPRMSSDI